MAKLSRRQVRTKLLWQQNRAAILLVISWFAANFAVFLLYLHRTPSRALLALFYFEPDPSRWGTFYLTMSDFVVFGMVVSVVATGVSRHYRPEQTGAILAKSMTDHVVVIGHTNFGQRVVDLCHSKNIGVVVIDPDRARVDGLIREEHPLVIAAGTDVSELDAANVSRAKLVVIAEEGVEVASIAARRVRLLNPECAMILRCADDDVGAVLARNHQAKLVSTSKVAARHVEQYAKKHQVKACVLIGYNSLATRIQKALSQLGVKAVIIDEGRAKPGNKSSANVHGDLKRDQIVFGDAASYETLEKAAIKEADLVVLTGEELGHSLVICDRVRDLNASARLIVRVFHEDAGLLLTQAPFKADVVSTSRHALATLVKEGAFECVGISRDQAKPG
jgi:Trk K+ transport system NAD-binding subunit